MNLLKYGALALLLGLFIAPAALGQNGNGQEGQDGQGQETPEETPSDEGVVDNGGFLGTLFNGAISAAVVMIAAGFGISKIGAAAVEGMARQPEAAGRIQTGMIISAALIEGATFFALVVCILEIAM